MRSPDAIRKGLTKKVTIANCHEKNAQMTVDMTMPNIPSSYRPRTSEVSPLTVDISSISTFVKTPGDLSVLSCHDRCFVKIALKSLSLSVQARLSPP